MVNSCIPRLLAYPSIPCQRFVFSYASAPDIVRYSSESWCDRFSYIEALELSYLNFKDDKHILFIRRYRTDFLSTIYLHTCFISHSVSQPVYQSVDPHRKHVRWPHRNRHSLNKRLAANQLLFPRAKFKGHQQPHSFTANTSCQFPAR